MPIRSKASAMSLNSLIDRVRGRFAAGRIACSRLLGRIRKLIIERPAVLALTSVTFVLGCSTSYEVAKLAAVGDVRELREPSDRQTPISDQPALAAHPRNRRYEARCSVRPPGERKTTGS